MTIANPKREARYRQLLQAAVKIFARDGIDAASIADIAQAAGVAKGSVYLYFDSKESLSGDLVAYLFTFPEDGPSPKHDPRPLGRIVAFCASIEERVLSLGQDAPIVLHMFGHIGKTADDQLARGVRQLMAEARFMIELLLHNAQDHGTAPQGLDLHRCASGILSVAFGAIHARLAGGPDAAHDAPGVAENVRVYLRGLGTTIDMEA